MYFDFLNNSLNVYVQQMDVIDLDVATPQKKDRRGKIAESDFTPRTRKLAKTAKARARALTVMEEAYPDDASVASMRALTDTVDNSIGPNANSFEDALRRANQSTTVREDLLTFVSVRCCFTLNSY